MGVLCWMTGHDADARAWFGAAADLKARFNRDWWLEDERVRRAGAGSRQAPVRAATSNVGHCLATGIIDDDHVPAGRRPAVRARHVQRLGHPHAVGRPSLLQPAELSPRHGLGGRAGDDRLRPAAVRLRLRARSIWRARSSISPRSTPSTAFRNASAATRAASTRRPARIRRPTRRSSGTPPRFRCVQTLVGIVPLAPSTRSSSIRCCRLAARARLRRTSASAGRPPRCGSGATRADGRKFQVLHKRGTLHVVRQPPPESLSADLWQRAPRRHGVSSMTIRLKPLRDQVIVITGASSGIGLVTARRAARQGAAVVLAARNEPDLREAVADIRRSGGRAIYVAADVVEPERRRGARRRGRRRVRPHRHLGQQRGGLGVRPLHGAVARRDAPAVRHQLLGRRCTAPGSRCRICGRKAAR